MAAGSQGWSPNWADLPAAASRTPANSRFFNVCGVLSRGISDNDQDLNSESLREKNRRIPISPIRL